MAIFFFFFFQIADSTALLSLRVFISTASLLPACSMSCGKTAPLRPLNAFIKRTRANGEETLLTYQTEEVRQQPSSEIQKNSQVSVPFCSELLFSCADKKPAHFPYLFSLKLKEEVFGCFFFCWWQSWAEIWLIGAPRSGDGHLPGGFGLPAVTPCRRWDKPASDIHVDYFIHIHCHIFKQMKVFYHLNLWI